MNALKIFHHELGQDAHRYDCMDAGGRATQESKPRTMQELLSRHEVQEGDFLCGKILFHNYDNDLFIRSSFQLLVFLRGEIFLTFLITLSSYFLCSI